MDDKDYWNYIDPEDLWVTDKLLLAKRLGYVCGPAGVPPPCADFYVVRPCVNYRMMSRGAQIMFLSPDEYESVPDGYFWVERFRGRHISYDYNYGFQYLAVEGFRDDPTRLDRFSKWRRLHDSEIFYVPDILIHILKKYKWTNIETIGGRVIEVHFRYNDDFRGHIGEEIIPVWKDEFIHSPCGDRVGFIIKEK